MDLGLEEFWEYIDVFNERDRYTRFVQLHAGRVQGTESGRLHRGQD